jgi:DNA-directed RNA polymerase specialized sigma24 family protein
MPPVDDLLQFDGLVFKLARRYGARYPVRDSEQYADGWVGLLRYWPSYQPDQGVCPLTEAFRCIRWGILDGFHERGESPRRRRRRRRTVLCRSNLPDPGQWDNLVHDFPARPAPDPAIAVDARTCLHAMYDRPRRLVDRVYLQGWTQQQAGAAEDPAITRFAVREFIDRGFRQARSLR